MNDSSAHSPMLVAAKLMDQVLAGEIPPETALDEWPDCGDIHATLLNNAWTALRHFADDADIHETDQNYLDSERYKLKECVLRLRHDRS